MNLNYIKSESCRTCGAMATIDRRSERAHSNGTRNESREYACGATLEYISNYESLRTGKECPKTPAQTERNARRMDLFTAVWNVIQTNADGADKDYVAALINDIRHHKPA